MIFLKLILDRFGHYFYDYASNREMGNLALFLMNVGCYEPVFKQWAMANKLDPNSEFSWSFSGNVTFMEEEDGFIYLSTVLPLEEGEEFVEFKIAKEKLIKILDDWEEKVCKFKPREVTIKYENNEFIFETKQ